MSGNRLGKTRTLISALVLMLSACQGDLGPVSIDANSVERLESGVESAASSAQALSDEGTDSGATAQEEIVEDEDARLADRQLLAVSDTPEGLVRASDLLTYSVAGVGAVEDLVVDLESGRILYLLIAAGGLLDFSPEIIAVPLSVLHWGEEETLQLAVDESLLNNAPIVRDDWPDATTPIWDDQLVHFWQQANVPAPADIADPAPIVRASAVVDSGLTDFVDLQSGAVEDLLIDLSEGRAKYVLATLLQDEPIAVPFSAFDVSASARELIFDSNVTEPLLQEIQSTNLSNLPGAGMIASEIDEGLSSLWENAGFDVDIAIETDETAETAAAETQPAATGSAEAEAVESQESSAAAEATETGEMQSREDAQSEQSPSPHVTVHDQSIEDGTIVVERVVSQGPGWIVIHADENGAPGPVIGYSPVDSGDNQNVPVYLNTAVATPMLYAVLHADAGTVGIYEFPRPDEPATVDGELVVQPFQATGDLAQ